MPDTWKMTYSGTTYGPQGDEAHLNRPPEADGFYI